MIEKKFNEVKEKTLPSPKAIHHFENEYFKVCLSRNILLHLFPN